MRSIVWLGSGMAALLFAVAAVVGLRGTPPPSRSAPQPAPAALTQPAPATASTPASVVPSFDIVRIDPNGQAVIAGRAAPGDKVRVLDGDQPLGEVTADARGEWVLLPDKPIAPGNRQLSLEATGHDGSPARHSKDVVALTILPPSGVNQPGSALAVLLPGDASQPSRVLQQPAANAAGLTLDTADYGAQGRLVLSGRADPAARVSIYAGDRLLGTATADAAGKWSLTARHPGLAKGTELRLDQLTADGSVARRIAVPFETSTAAAPGTDYVVERGNSLWLIARQVYGQGMRYTAIYGANRSQIRDPNRIYPGQQFKLPPS